MSDTLELKLLGKEYRVACRPEERDGLLAAVALLEGKFAEAGNRPTAGTKASGERVAVMVALNLAHELHAARSTPAHQAAALESESIRRRIDSIEAKLDETLVQHEQLF